MKFNQRVQCLSLRNSLSKEERITKSEIICDKVIELIKDKKNIMSYKTHGNEVDVEKINLSFDNLSYPIILKNGIMEAHQANSFTKGKFNISEPYKGKRIDTNDLDVIIVPLVGFDLKKNRLGHGWGYYDKFLKNSNALKIGVAFEIQKVDEIIVEEYDIPLDIIITENNIYQ